jgi:NAD(P)H-dependent flavin oxidoreductase YrpB (nitropropane dioxygenase family)
MLTTPLCRQLGIVHPIFSVGMGAAAGPELAAAVSNAGGCGVIGGTRLSPDGLRMWLERTRNLTDRPFGVNLIIAVMNPGVVDVALEARVPVVIFFWGDPAPYVADAHRRGSKVFVQVGSVEEATKAAAAGVDGVIAQGVEAGGHVRSTTSLSTLLPAVVEAVAPVPVIAAGGIASGRGVAAALSLGAEAVSLGTRFIASEEADAPREYKERLVRATAEDTVYTGLFDIGWPNAPHRVLRNKVVQEWEAAGRPPSGQRPSEGSTIGSAPRDGGTVDVPRYASFMVTAQFKGDLEYAPLWAGESVRLIGSIKPAGAIVEDLVREATTVLAALRA